MLELILKYIDFLVLVLLLVGVYIYAEKIGKDYILFLKKDGFLIKRRLVVQIINFNKIEKVIQRKNSFIFYGNFDVAGKIGGHRRVQTVELVPNGTFDLDDLQQKILQHGVSILKKGRD